VEELHSGFHPARGCIKRLQEHQEQIDTDFRDLRSRFAKGFPAISIIPAVPTATLNAILAEVIANAPKRLRELQQQLADCLYWELQRHGQHICGGIEVSERTIRALYAEIHQLQEEILNGASAPLYSRETARQIFRVH
jgi:hypothetical protein